MGRSDPHGGGVVEAFKKDKRVNSRLSSRDLAGVQKKAMKEAIPYQTLMASVIHKYVSGALVQRKPK